MSDRVVFLAFSFLSFSRRDLVPHFFSHLHHCYFVQHFSSQHGSFLALSESLGCAVCCPIRMTKIKTK